MRQALAALSDVDLLKLERSAVWLASRRSISPDDLLQEAICRSLEGARRCPRGVCLVSFVINAMRSILSSHQKATAGDPIELATPVSALGEEDGEVDPLANIRDSAPTPEQLLLAEDEANQMKAALHSLFDDDPDAELVLLDIFAGLTAGETRADLQLGETEYATIRRRIRRRINQHYPEGWKS
jgi:DNA-directed RNA polymerase specialized sigma24 family protein